MPKITFSEFVSKHLGKIVLETLYLVGLSALIAIVFGLIIGSILFITRKSNKKYIKVIYKILDIIVNVFRSFPFIILVFFVIPFTRDIMKLFTGIATSSGNSACIVPLSIAAIPFFSKVIENSLMEVDSSVVEASVSLGLTNFQIITKVVLREALPSIVSGITLGIITLVGFSAMAGYVGAGGIGNFAIMYGVNNSDQGAILYSVITVILLVQGIQLSGNFIYKIIK